MFRGVRTRYCFRVDDLEAQGLRDGDYERNSNPKRPGRQLTRPCGSSSPLLTSQQPAAPVCASTARRVSTWEENLRMFPTPQVAALTPLDKRSLVSSEKRLASTHF